MVLTIKESPKYLLINRNDRAAAKEALIYYQEAKKWVIDRKNYFVANTIGRIYTTLANIGQGWPRMLAKNWYWSDCFYITGELLPQLHRSTGQAVVFFVTLVISFCFSFVTLPAYEYYTSLAFIPLFIIPGLLCTLYLYLYLPETKGREAHEIVEELRQATSSRNKIHSTSLQRVY
uniref:Uncharacterized protein n=1 Tax=Ditylenchus dipsaci TaxID=166011 RepID=A0A915E7X1_9BILA